MIPPSRLSPQPESLPVAFEEWLPLRGRWLSMFLDGIKVAGAMLLFGAFAGTLGPRYHRGGNRLPQGAAACQIASFKTAVELYRLDHGGECPRRLRDLLFAPSALPGDIARWKGPYLCDLTSVPPDPWGHPYLYRVPGANGSAYEVRSLGKDGLPGGVGDAEDLSSVKR